MTSHIQAVPVPNPEETELTNDAVEPFEEFFELEHVRLFGALCVMTGNRSEAEEIMQDAFLNSGSDGLACR